MHNAHYTILYISELLYSASYLELHNYQMFFSPLKMDGRELGIGIVPYCPVGRGLFAGKKVVENIPQESYLVRMTLFEFKFPTWLLRELS